MGEFPYKNFVWIEKSCVNNIYISLACFESQSDFENMHKGFGRLAVLAVAVLVVSAPVAATANLSHSQQPTGGKETVATHSQETSLRTDSHIDATILNFNQDSGEYTAGETVTAEVEVRNTGSVEHTFFVGYSVRGPDGELYDNGGETGTTVTLDPNERTWVTLSWTVEDSAPTGDYDALTSVWEESDPDNLRTRLDSEERSNAFEVIDENIDAEVTDFDVDGGEYNENDDVDATARIENTGNTDHTFFVGYSVRGPDGTWRDNNEDTGQTVTLEAGESTSVSLKWDVEDDAPTGDYDAKTAVWEESDRDNLQTRLDSANEGNAFEVVEPTNIDARITSFDIEGGEHREGDVVDAIAYVKNTGNTEHTFFVGYSVRGPDGTWRDNNGETGRTVTLDPGESTQVSMSWQVQSDASDGQYDAKVAIWRESNRDNLQTRLDLQDRQNAFEVVEPTNINARIASFDIEGGEHREGDVVDAIAYVKNTGNTEHTFFVGYSVRGPDGTWRDNNGETGRTVTLDPGESTQVSMSWQVQSEAPAGQYDAKVAIWRETNRDNLQTRLDLQDRQRIFEVTNPTTIDANVDLIDVSRGEFNEDETIDARARVENIGNTEHTFFIGFSVRGPDGIWRDNDGETGRTVTLEAEESTTISLSWDVEGAAPAGQYDAKIAVWQESDRNNLNTRLDRVRRNSVFTVIESAEATAQITSIDVDSGDFQVGETIESEVQVENTGNTQRTFFVGYSVRGPDGTWRDNEARTGQTVTLAPGERRDITLEWTVTDEAPSGVYDVRVSVWRESDRENLQTRLDNTRRTDAFEIVDPVKIDAEIINADIESGDFKPGDTVEATAVIRNTGDSEHAFFVSYSVMDARGDPLADLSQSDREISLGPGENQRVRFSWKLDQDQSPGKYGVRLSVRNQTSSEDPGIQLAQTQLTEAFRVTEVADINVVDVSVSSGPYRVGDRVKIETQLANPAQARQRLVVGTTIEGPNGRLYGGEDTRRSVSIGAGERTDVQLIWKVPEGTPRGEYDITTSVYPDSSTDDKSVLTERTHDRPIQIGIRSDVFEPNDDPSTVTYVTTGKYDLTLGPGDRDFFRISVEAGQKLTVTTTLSETSKNRLAIVEADTRKTIDTATGTGSNTVTAAPQADTAYYIITNNNGPPAEYTLTLEEEQVENSDVLKEDPYEDNNKPGNAKRLSDGTTDGLTISQGNPDFYELGYNQGDPIQLDITAEADSKIIAVLKEPDGDIVGRVSSVTPGTTIEGAAGEDGIYLLEVYGYESNRVLYTVSQSHETGLPALEETTIESLDNFGEPSDSTISNQEYVLQYVIGMKSIDEDDHIAAFSGFIRGLTEVAEEAGSGSVNAPSALFTFLGNLVTNFHETIGQVKQSIDTGIALLNDKEVRSRAAYQVAVRQNEEIEDYPTPYDDNPDKKAAFASGWVKGYLFLTGIFVAHSATQSARSAARKISSWRDAKEYADENNLDSTLGAMVWARSHNKKEAINTLARVDRRLSNHDASKKDLTRALTAEDTLRYHYGNSPETKGDLADGMATIKLLNNEEDLGTVENVGSIPRTEDGELQSGRYLMHNVEVDRPSDEDAGEFDLVLIEVVNEGGESRIRVRNVYETTLGTSDSHEDKYDQVVSSLRYVETANERQEGEVQVGRGLEPDHFTQSRTEPITVGPREDFDITLSPNPDEFKIIDVLIDDAHLIPGYKKRNYPNIGSTEYRKIPS